MIEAYSDWLQLWPYAILMIVIASWVLYHFLAPASWRDWAGAGLVQAFIIALYAEMYGFPLTIYLLTSFLPIDISLAAALRKNPAPSRRFRGNGTLAADAYLTARLFARAAEPLFEKGTPAPVRQILEISLLR